MARRFRRRPAPSFLVALSLLALLAVRAGCDRWVLPPGEQDTPLLEGRCRITRVVDGDTLIVEQNGTNEQQSRRSRVRLLGVDTPETVKPDTPVERWGPEATQFTCQFLAGGEARLQFDRRRQDRYGRTLAYVFVDDRMLNEELVRAGLARVSVFPGDSPTITRRLHRAAEEARTARRGIWKE